MTVLPYSSQYYSITLLQYYRISASIRALHYCSYRIPASITALHYYSITVFQPVMQYYSVTLLQYYRISASISALHYYTITVVPYSSQ